MRITITLDNDSLDSFLEKNAMLREMVETTKKYEDSSGVGFGNSECSAYCKKTKAGFCVKFWDKENEHSKL